MGTCLSKKPGCAPAAATTTTTTTKNESSSCSSNAVASGVPATLKKPAKSSPVSASKKKSPGKPAGLKPKSPLAEISNLDGTIDHNKGKEKPDQAATQAEKDEGCQNTTGPAARNKVQRDDTTVLAKGVEKKECGTVRTSSCTKDEVDAILIQCGRLSRSSSGKSSGETKDAPVLTANASTKRHSGSKRHLEHQSNEKENIEDQGEAADDEGVGKPYRSRSSHKRTLSGGEMGGVAEYYYKRSSSRERNLADQQAGKSTAGGETRRRVSRSPAKRSEATPDKSNRALRSARSASSENCGRQVVNKRNHNLTSRSRSPATGRSVNTGGESNNAHPAPTLSRNSSKKTDHSPYRRPIPTSESTPTLQDSTDPSITITATTNGVTEEGDGRKRRTNHQSHSRTQSMDGSSSAAGNTKDSSGNSGTTITVPHIREQLLTCRAKQVQRQPSPAKTHPSEKLPVDVSAEITEGSNLESESRTLTRTVSGRRSAVESVIDSFVESPELYLPACVSKACSILEAVADLNSRGTAAAGRAREIVPFEFLDSAIRHSEDNQYSNSLHKYVSVRREMIAQPAYSEGQESSAGSNTVMTCSSSWEPASADSTDRWVDGNSLNKLTEEANSASSASSTKDRFPSTTQTAGRDDFEEARRATGCRSNKSSDSEKLGYGRYNGRLRPENAANNGVSRFTPVITLSNSMKKEIFRECRV